MENLINNVYHEPNLETMKRMQDNSIDAIVTDPPYGLAFMGKKWDYDVPSIEIWQECLRVLKPGGHLLAFAGTRTQHRMAVRIEDAGFEIRDIIMWVYGSGFPKSHDISKAIDKAAGAEREVVSTIKKKPSASNDCNEGWVRPWAEGKTTMDITAPATPEAQQWDGWGTALKPSVESITLAQKPFECGSDIENLFVSLLKQIKLELCQYKSFATIAEKNLRLSPKERNGVLSIAQWLAGNNTSTQDDLCVLMDTSQFLLTENTNWSIVLSWLNILDALYEAMSTFTIETKTSLIIDLKTLKSLEWANIFQNIIQDKDSQTSGLPVNVWNVESLLNALRLKLGIIQELFAQEVAMSKANEKAFAPNASPIIMSRKPLQGTVAENVLTWGTGGINIDGCRVGTEEKLTGGHHNNSRHRNKFFKSLDNVGCEYKHGKGRFPANLIHDGSEEVVGMFPETASGTGSIRKKAKGLFGLGGDGEHNIEYGDSGSAARFFYQAKADKGERGQGNTHPTVKPVDLMRYLCRLVTPPGGVVYDPFTGSGTTLIAAHEEGFNWIGSEMTKEYWDIAVQRIKEHTAQQKLF